jgi:nucleotide-binding universal stress UspA family protein
MFDHILLPTDGSTPSLNAVQAGINFAKDHGAKVTIYHAIEPVLVHAWSGGGAMAPDLVKAFGEHAQEAGQRIVNEAANAAERTGVPCEVEVDRPESPDLGINDAAARHGCDLIFIGSHGRSGIAGLLLGSVTRKVLAHATIPVMVYR